MVSGALICELDVATLFRRRIAENAARAAWLAKAVDLASLVLDLSRCLLRQHCPLYSPLIRRRSHCANLI